MKKFLVLVMVLCTAFALGLAHAETADENHGTTVQGHAADCENIEADLYECEDPACYVAATCTVDGKQAKHCTACGRIIEVETLEKGHKFVTVEEEEPYDCTKDWTKPYEQCEVCEAYPVDEDGKEILPETIPAKEAHTVVPVIGEQWDVCGVTDSFPAMCSVCEMELEGSIKMTIDHGKANEEVIKGREPGCYYTGMTDGVRCKKCGATKVEQEELDIVDHNWVYRAGTAGNYCHDVEWKAHYQCSYCDQYSFGEKDKDGKIVIVDWDDVYVPGTEHVAVKIPAKDATCEEDGWKGDGTVCSQCGWIIKYPTPIPGGHIWVRDQGTAATCEEDGVNAHNFCDRCGETDGKDTVIPAHGHSYEEGYWPNQPTEARDEKWEIWDVDAYGYEWCKEKPKRDADCENDGYVAARYCQFCLERLGEKAVPVTEGKVLPKTGHKLETVEGLEGWAPTCSYIGWTAYQVCVNDGCDYVVDQQVIAALGHILTPVAAVAPTCTEAGNYAYFYCTRENCDVEDAVYFELAEVGEDAFFNNHLTVPGEDLFAEWSRVYIGKAPDSDKIPTPTMYEIPATDHGQRYYGYDWDALIEDEVWGKIAAVDATCTTNGREGNGIYCTLCDAVIVKPIVIEAYGHNGVIFEGVPATCTETGIQAFIYCTNEGCTYGEVSVPSSFEEDEVDGMGIVGAVAAINLVKNEDGSLNWEKLPAEVIIPALGHDAVPGAAQEPTCTEDGWTAGEICSRCKVTLKEQETIKKTGHNLLETKPGKAPTCTEFGYKPYMVCQNKGCAYTEGGEYDIVEALGHDYANATVIPGKAPTCNKPGTTDATKCGREGCDHLLIDHKVIDATGKHNWEFTNDKGEKANAQFVPLKDGEFTCTTTQYENYNSCLDCDYEEGWKWGGEGHDLIVYNEEKPTCTEMGLTEDIFCKNNCGYHEVAKVVPALGHDYVKYYGEDEDDKAPTCTEDGWTEGEKCSRCDTIKVASEPKDALGHDWKHVDAVAATCTTDGNTVGLECTRCDEKSGVEVIKAKGHKGVWSVEIEPTYDEYGLEVEICSECGAKLDAKLIDKLVLGYLKGDVNKDGRVSLSDVLELLKVLAGESTNYSAENADMNGDSVPTLSDVFELLAIL